MVTHRGTREVALCGLFWLFSALSHAESGKTPLSELFFSSPTELQSTIDFPMDQYRYVGFVERGSQTAIALVRGHDESSASITHILSVGDQLAGLPVMRIDSEQIALQSNAGEIVLAMDGAGADLKLRNTALRQAAETASNGSNTPKRRSAMGFHPGATDARLKSLARVAGVPDAVLGQIAVGPIPARSQSGRPGWSIDPMLESIAWLNLPIQRGDVILALDGISVHDLEMLEQHLSVKSPTEPYRVELQRNRRAVILEFRQ